MEFYIKFEYNIVKTKVGQFKGYEGDVSIKSDSPKTIDEIKNDDNVKGLIFNGIKLKRGEQIFSLEITHVEQINM